MRCDESLKIGMESLTESIERFRSVVTEAAEEVRGYLARSRTSKDRPDEGIAASLGRFGGDLFDVERFRDLVCDDSVGSESDDQLQNVEAAYEILQEMAAAGDDLFRLDVKAGGRLGELCARKWAEIGRGFAAARVAGAVLKGRNSSTPPLYLGPLRFEEWQDAERRIAPPLAVEVDGADFSAGELAAFLDAGIKILVVVRGESSPAPLVRLITPSTFVLQTNDGAGLDRFAASAGPAVAAFVAAEGAHFVHDPAAGDTLHERLEIHHVPTAIPQGRVGGISTGQQREEVEQLLALAAAGAKAEEPHPDGGAEKIDVTRTVAADDPVDRLAAWLLARAQMEEVE